MKREGQQIHMSSFMVHCFCVARQCSKNPYTGCHRKFYLVLRLDFGAVHSAHTAIKKRQSLLHRHFHQPDHSVDDMRVQILEKVHQSSENPTLLTSIRRTRELFWIKELGTAKPYGFNDQIKGVGTLSSISCKKTNIL